jgi:hypothetical protein
MTNIEKSTQVLREEHRLIERPILAFTGIICSVPSLHFLRGTPAHPVAPCGPRKISS